MPGGNMEFLSNDELKELFIEWINDYVTDPLDSGIRGDDAFAFSELRKGSEKLPKMLVTTDSHIPTQFFFGPTRPFDSEIIFFVWMYVKVGKENIYVTDRGAGLKNEQLVEHWLTGELIKALRKIETLPVELTSPTWGDFSGSIPDADRPGVIKGFVPVSFKVHVTE